MNIYETIVASSSFIVDTSADYVGIHSLGGMFRNAYGKAQFQAGDSSIIASAGIIVPEGFTFSGIAAPTLTPYMQIFGAEYVGGVPINFFSLNCVSHIVGGANDRIFILAENTDFTINGFSDYTTYKTITGATVTGNFCMGISQMSGVFFSMIGAPAALNGKTISFYPYLKLTHNLPLI